MTTSKFLIILTSLSFNFLPAQSVQTIRNDSTAEVIDTILSGLFPALIFIFFEDSINRDRRLILGILDDFLIILIPPILSFFIHTKHDIMIFSLYLTFVFIILVIVHF